MTTLKKLLIVIILLFGLVTGCGIPSQKLIRYPVTPFPTELVATLEASLIKITPQPYPEKFILPQDVDDLLDSAQSNSFAVIAVHQLEKAINDDVPGIQNPSVFLTLAIRYEDLGETQKAIENYTKSIELYDSGEVHLYRGELYYQQGDYEKARQDILKFLSFEMPDEIYDFEKNQAYQILLDIQIHQ